MCVCVCVRQVELECERWRVRVWTLVWAWPMRLQHIMIHYETKTQEHTTAVQLVPGMRLRVFDFGV